MIWLLIVTWMVFPLSRPCGLWSRLTPFFQGRRFSSLCSQRQPLKNNLRFKRRRNNIAPRKRLETNGCSIEPRCFPKIRSNEMLNKPVKMSSLIPRWSFFTRVQWLAIFIYNRFLERVVLATFCLLCLSSA